MNHYQKTMYWGGLLVLFGSPAFAQDNSAFDACRKAVGEQTQAVITEMKLKRKKDGEYYKIKARGDEGVMWEFKCDSAGKIFEKELEVPSAAYPAFAALKKIDEEPARKIVLEAYPGTITEVEYEIANDAPIYEFEVKTADGREMEVEIDAVTGKIVKAEED
ncbi:MAG: hypothetical protein Kow0065_19850 [Methylomicrobium sp.]